MGVFHKTSLPETGGDPMGPGLLTPELEACQGFQFTWEENFALP